MPPQTSCHLFQRWLTASQLIAAIPITASMSTMIRSITITSTSNHTLYISSRSHLSSINNFLCYSFYSSYLVLHPMSTKVLTPFFIPTLWLLAVISGTPAGIHEQYFTIFSNSPHPKQICLGFINSLQFRSFWTPLHLKQTTNLFVCSLPSVGSSSLTVRVHSMNYQYPSNHYQVTHIHSVYPW